MKQEEVFYHGSVIGNLDTILANAKSHADGSRVAYFTTDRVYALVCCRSREENLVTMGLREDGKLQNTKGHIWESHTDVPVILRERVRDVYPEILREEAAGNVVIHRYDEIDPEEQKTMANYMRDHLNDPDHAAIRDFEYKHFSPLWD